ncbi:MAG TPA: PIN domain-containing protein [Sedimentisphaerales bacterium]|nr:PIN domain-containing protein [Sedimentisphaerales bacterium]HRS09828.1 PIN domain-containing protein [Sedimentisphaerales bacterium]HRV46522.1 PIN domain-containing protein [Sedimentisphaerales bacterium]
MNVFVDTNVLLDVLARREPFYAHSVGVWTLAEQGRVKGFISAISFNNIYYVTRKLRTRQAARRMMAFLRDTFEPVPLDKQILDQAIDADFEDLEDAIQYFSAVRAKSDCIISRDANVFPKPDLPVLTPAEFLSAHTF